jgi:hypothetical protein
VIDIAKLREYKWCSRGILAALGCGSRWFRSGFRCFARISALDGVVQPSSLLTGSTGADRGLTKAWRWPLCHWTMLLLGGVGVLAFLLSALLPGDDSVQQEYFHNRVSHRVMGRNTREAAGNAASVRLATLFWPAAKPLLIRPCGLTYPLYFTPVSSDGEFQLTTRASRAPPASV